MTGTRRLLYGGLALVTALVIAVAAVSIRIRTNREASIIVGYVAPAPPEVIDDIPPKREPPPPAPEGEPGGVPRFTRPATRGLWPPDGRPPGPAKRFLDAVDTSGGLQFVLILGSDARSGNPERARTDSIHVLALDPSTQRGTIVGIPRDSWVDIPGHGKRKINEAMNLGGPELAVRTLRNVTGMPITYYILTAFQGMQSVVNDLGGVDVYVPYDMNDPPSAAFFQAGWHRMDGGKALAFSRNRHIPAGDFARSENQGRLMLDVLKKLRAETERRREVEAWLNILVKHVRLDMSFSELVRLGLLARITAASSVNNVVAPGRVGTAGGASVVFLTEQANELFRDVGSDAVANGSYPRFGPPPGEDQPPPPPEEPPPSSPPPEPPAPPTTILLGP